jgi:hypothetical protein
VKARISVAVLLMLSLMAMPSAALGGVWKEGTAFSQFSIQSYGGLLDVRTAGDSVLTLPYEASPVFTLPSLSADEMRSVRQARDGSFLVAGGRGQSILRISQNGQNRPLVAVGGIPALDRPWDAFPLDSGGMLMVDRGPQKAEDSTPTGWIMRVDADNRRVWRFDTWQGPLLGQLLDPFTAEPSNGDSSRTLIADSLGCRVIEIDSSTGEVLWYYGHYREKGSAEGYLRLPHSAQRLPNGNTLICDSENQRVIEVTPSKTIAWSYRTPGVVGESGPNSARRLINGNTLITDSGGDRVIEVNQARTIVQGYGAAGRVPSSGALENPRAATRLADNSTLIADYGNRRLVRYGYPVRREYVAVSSLIDPAIGEMKRFGRITVNAVRPQGATVFAEYTIDNRAWLDVPASGVLPASAKGSAIRYRLRLTAAKADAAPIVNDVAITWSTVAPTTSKSSSAGSGTTHHSSTSKSAGSTASSSTATGRTTVKRGSRRVSAGGSGSAESTTVAAGGSSSAIDGGTAGGSGGSGGDAVTQSTTLSGWVMSEVKDDVAGLNGNSGTGGFAPSGGLGDSKIPGVALMFFVYAIGFVWSPASKVVVRFAVSAITH